MDELEKYLIAHLKLERAEKADECVPMQQYRCQKCKDTGWLTSYDGKYEVLKRCGCYAVKRAEELIGKSEISAEFRKKSFDGFDTKGNPMLINARNKAINYVKNFKKTQHSRYNSIMFCGQPGSGKTHLGTAICSRLLYMGIPVIYMAYRNAMTRIKQRITDETAYNRELGKYMDADVLYIDDMLKGRLTETDVNVIYEIINYRYMNSLPLIISTEKDLNGLLMFDEATASRIIEMCKDNIAVLKGRELNYRMDLQGSVNNTKNKNIR